ncbi:MAG: AAA family ATPase [Acidimicrobiales bacterium]
MRPLGIELEGLGSYARSSRIDLAELEVVAITGENGAGKSTIAEAIVIALYGRPVRSTQLDPMIARGRDTMRVVLDFEHAGRVYRVTRERTRNKHSDALVEMRSEDGSYETVAKEPRVVDRYLADLIGVSREAFLSTALLAQGDAARFCRADPVVRKTLFSELLGLDRFAVLAERAKRRREALEAECAHLERTVAALDAELAREPADLSRRAALEVEIAARQAEVAALETTLAEGRAGAEALERLTAEIASFDERRERELTAATKAGVEAQRRVERAERDLVAATAGLRSASTQLEAGKAAAGQVATLQAELVRLDGRLGELVTAEESIVTSGQACRAELDRCGVEIEQLEARVVEAKERLGVVGAHPDAPECYACGQPLTEEHRAELVAEIEASLAGLAVAITARGAARDGRRTTREQLKRDLEATRADKTSAMAARDATSAQLAAAKVAADGVCALVEAHAAATARLENAQSERDDASRAEALQVAEIAEAEAGSVSARAELGAKLETARASGAGLGAATARHAELQGWLARSTLELGGLVERCRRYDEARGELEGARTEAAGAHARARRLTTLERAFGRDGIPRLVVEGALGELEADIADVLGRLASTGISVHLTTEKETKKGVRETLEVVVEDSHGEQALEMLSGGEALRVSLAVNAGLARLMRRRFGGGADLLFFDEPSALDAEGVRALVDWLWVLHDEISLIAVITHLDGVASAFEHRLVVGRGDDGSHVELLAS